MSTDPSPNQNVCYIVLTALDRAIGLQTPVRRATATVIYQQHRRRECSWEFNRFLSPSFFITPSHN